MISFPRYLPVIRLMRCLRLGPSDSWVCSGTARPWCDLRLFLAPFVLRMRTIYTTVYHMCGYWSKYLLFVFLGCGA